jgi:MoaA/NifB/PqqE/SkfB family radical SAM enzyme
MITTGKQYCETPFPGDMREVSGSARPPDTIQFEITHRCNLRCNMCYNGSGSFKGEELSDGEWLDLCVQATEIGVMAIVISGGEPLLRGHDLLIRMIEIFAKANVRVHLITNGAFVDISLVRSLRGHTVEVVQTSIDGSKATTHDTIRGRNFGDVLEATHLFASNGFNTRVAATIQKTNENELDDIVDLAVLLGAHEIILDPLLPIGRAAKDMKIWPSRSLKSIFSEVDELSKKYSHLISVRHGLDPHEQLQMQARQSEADSFIIRPDGSLRMACLCPFSFGNVKNTDVKQAWSSFGVRAWQSPQVREFVKNVSGREALHREYTRLGIRSGRENVEIQDFFT